jgi:hypothetical protein
MRAGVCIIVAKAMEAFSIGWSLRFQRETVSSFPGLTKPIIENKPLLNPGLSHPEAFCLLEPDQGPAKVRKSTTQ